MLIQRRVRPAWVSALLGLTATVFVLSVPPFLVSLVPGDFEWLSVPAIWASIGVFFWFMRD